MRRRVRHHPWRMIFVGSNRSSPPPNRRPDLVGSSESEDDPPRSRESNEVADRVLPEMPGEAPWQGADTQ